MTLEFGTVSAENIILSVLVFILCGVIGIRYMMRRSMRQQLENFERFKLDISQKMGETLSNLQQIRGQAEANNRQLEKRVEHIEHQIVQRDDFVREVTLLHATNGDLLRYILAVNTQLENLKNIMLKNDGT